MVQAVSGRWEERTSAKWRGDPVKKALAGFEKRCDTACYVKRVAFGCKHKRWGREVREEVYRRPGGLVQQKRWEQISFWIH